MRGLYETLTVACSASSRWLSVWRGPYTAASTLLSPPWLQRAEPSARTNTPRSHLSPLGRAGSGQAQWGLAQRLVLKAEEAGRT